MKSDGLRNGAKIIITYWLYVFGYLTGFARTAFIPNDAVLKINSSESDYLASICGLSTEYSNDTTEDVTWAVSIMYKGKNRLGGTIISPYHILTAAHAFVRFDNSLPGIGEPCLVYGYRRYASVLSREVAFGDDCIRYEQRSDHLGRGAMSPFFDDKREKRESRKRFGRKNDTIAVKAGHTKYSTCKQRSIYFNKVCMGSFFSFPNQYI
uniref:Peptidase S1 domain-containing protein n=1 Tax=Ditylenchus dipsaci TaxID=166011 RepID=A0A915DJ00_9BILA